MESGTKKVPQVVGRGHRCLQERLVHATIHSNLSFLFSDIRTIPHNRHVVALCWKGQLDLFGQEGAWSRIDRTPYHYTLIRLVMSQWSWHGSQILLPSGRAVETGAASRKLAGVVRPERAWHGPLRVRQVTEAR